MSVFVKIPVRIFLYSLRRDMHMGIGERIRKRRQAMGMSQQELANRVGVRRATISEFESGKRTSMTTDTAKRLARTLGVSVDYLIDTYGEDEEEPALVGTGRTAIP